MMKKYSMMEHKAGKAAFALLLFALLMLARDTLTTSSILGFAKAQFLGLGVLCLFGLAFLAVNRKQWKDILLDRRLLAMAATAAVIVLPMLIKRDWQIMYFSILFCPVAAVFLTYFTDVRETARYYLVIFCVLCVHSLVTMLLLKEPALHGQIPITWFCNSNEWWFLNFGLSYVLSWDNWYRNFGIFREPGVYQFFILLALYLNNYKADWKKLSTLWVINAILAVTMVSTFAIGGMLELGLFAVFLYFDRKWYRTPAGKAMGFGCTAVAVAGVCFIVYNIRQLDSDGTFWFSFRDMYLRLFTGSESLFDRVDAVFVSARLFFQSPLAGDTIANVLHGTENNTSSTLILYAVLGIAGGCLNVAAWVALAWEKRRSIFGNGVLLVILFMSFNTQNLIADVYFWLFPYMALMETVLPKIDFSGKKA